MDLHKVIIKPLYTERGTLLKEKENRYVFKVEPAANKVEIKRAVEQLFGVSVIRVNTAMFLGKKRRMGSHEGLRPEWKKAIVRLKKGQEIKPVDTQG